MTCLSAIFLCSMLAGAQKPALKAIPGELSWLNSPVSFKIENGETLRIAAAKSTDWFIDPFEGRSFAAAPMLLFEPGGDFVLSAKVTVDFRTKWDAGALFVYVNGTTWAKLALELSPDKRPTLVTVVTRGLSDDCNSFAIEGASVYLQVARRGDAVVFYASTDGRAWKILRSFNLGNTQGLRAGFEAQSPAGEGATAVFSEIRYAPKRIANIYTGE
jgi:regulation of enolase protein 1 (concanavalin A-like superfamily)